MKAMRLRRALLCCFLLTPACEDPAAPRSVADVVVAAGGGQAGQVASPLPEPVVVRVLDARGRGVAGVAVSWTAGAGAVPSADARTDRNGEASARWTLGTRAGGQQLQVTAAGRSVSVTATAGPGPAAQVTADSGSGEWSVVGETRAVRIRVTDEHGNGVAGVPLGYSTPVNSGSVSGPAVTGADGAAVLDWSLGRVPGVQWVTVSAAALAPFRVTTTTRAGAPAQLLRLVNEEVTAAVMARATLAVRLTDAFGNAIPGMRVSYTTDAAPADTTTVFSDQSGRASTVWLLPHRAGTYRVTVSAGGRTTFIDVIAVPGPAVMMVPLSELRPAGSAGGALPLVTVRVLDGYGNGVGDVDVVFEPGAASGSVSARTVRTDAAGLAGVQWTLGSMKGSQMLRVLAEGLVGSPATFTATAH